MLLKGIPEWLNYSKENFTTLANLIRAYCRISIICLLQCNWMKIEGAKKILMKQKVSGDALRLRYMK